MPWDHSALTGEFYFQQTAAGAALGDSAGPDCRCAAAVRSLRMSSRRPTPSRPATSSPWRRRASGCVSSQEANQADQQKIFDKQYETAAPVTPTPRDNLSMEIGKIQMQMVRRDQEQKKLREQITTLEGKLGIPPEKTEDAAK